MTVVISYDACHDGLSIAKNSFTPNLSPSFPSGHTLLGRLNKWAMSYPQAER